MPTLRLTGLVVALGSELELAGGSRRRRIPAREFFLDIMSTALEPDEVLVAIHIPSPTCRAHYPGGSNGCARRLLPRSRGLPQMAVPDVAIELTPLSAYDELAAVRPPELLLNGGVA
jgi:hypothetical protein